MSEVQYTNYGRQIIVGRDDARASSRALVWDVWSHTWSGTLVATELDTWPVTLGIHFFVGGVWTRDTQHTQYRIPIGTTNKQQTQLQTKQITRVVDTESKWDVSAGTLGATKFSLSVPEHGAHTQYVRSNKQKHKDLNK